MIRVTHIITSLEVGGAELVLERLVRHMDRGGFDVDVVSLADVGPVGRRITEAGTTVTPIGMMAGRIRPRDLRRLGAHLRSRGPRVVQTWMYHADLVGGVVAKVGLRDTAICWGVRNTEFPTGANKPVTRAVAWTNARIAKFVPDAIVCCSERALAEHIRRGYPEARTVLIPNGFELPRLDRAAARRRMLSQLGLNEPVTLIGRAGRFHPQKDYRTLLESFARLLGQHENAHLVMCGNGVDAANQELATWIAGLDISAHVHLLGPVDHMPDFHASLDVAVSSSAFGEAHPGVVGEAMAVGTPVVATDVGDSGVIVGELGKVVRPRDPAALSHAIAETLDASEDQRRRLGDAARQRIRDAFGLPAMVDRYEQLYRRLAASTGRLPRTGHGRF